MRLHTGERPYSCKVCSQTFVQSISLKIHMRKYTGEKPYSCDICDKSYSTKWSLISHKLTHNKKTPYSCRGCNKPFIKCIDFKRDMRIHTEENVTPVAVATKLSRRYIINRLTKRVSKLGDCKQNLVRFSRNIFCMTYTNNNY